MYSTAFCNEALISNKLSVQYSSTGIEVSINSEKKNRKEEQQFVPPNLFGNYHQTQKGVHLTLVPEWIVSFGPPPPTLQLPLETDNSEKTGSV